MNNKPKELRTWGTSIEREKRRRIFIWAYAYEIKNDSIVSDAQYDKTAYEIDPFMETGHSKLDDFFLFQFDASTGMWIHKHPHLKRIDEIYQEHFIL